MEYISAKELSLKWGISARRVQQYCAAGMIKGVYKVGNAWMIPSTVKRVAVTSNDVKYYPYLLLMDAYAFRPGEADKIFLSVHSPRERQQLECELAYFRGEFKGAKKLYESSEEWDKTRICTLNLAAVEAIATGEYKLFYELFEKLQSIKENYKESEVYHAVLEISIASLLASFRTAGADMVVPNPSSLPNELRTLYCFQECYKYYQKQNYDRVVGILETVFRFQDADTYTPRDIYMWLMCGLAYYELGDMEKADYYAKYAVDVGYQDSLVMPYAEFMMMYGSILSDRIKEKSMEMYQHVLKVCENTWNTYIPLYNSYAKGNITMLLSRQEYTIARFAVKGYSNPEIARQMGYSTATIKKKLESVYEKLGVGRRRELREFLR